ncbi:MAG: heparinase II/III family protein [Gammaproteobacteria bacterium]
MSVVRKAVWLWRRLSVMGPGEIVSRLSDQTYLLKLRWRHKLPPATLPEEPTASSRQPEFRVGSLSFDTAKLAVDYAPVLEGVVSYGGGDWQFDEGAEAWHREHTTLRDWPQLFFNAIDYRPGNPVGDARRSWEPARLQNLIVLAARARDLGAEPRSADRELALDLIERQLTSWWTHNPLLHGIHYVSAMECGLRCVSLAHVASLLEARGRLSVTVRAIVLATIEQHADFIRKRISSHSSAGNHTLAECAGLIYASLMLPERDASSEDEKFATELFVSEFDRQVNADGGGLEQATWYHRFNVELAECVSATLEANGRAVPSRLSNALDRGGRFLKALSACVDEFVKLGDSDDGYAVSRYYSGRWRALPEPASIQHFKQSGISCIQHFGWSLIVQYGPLGMAPSYGHGHADALNMVLTLDGVQLLCDSGTAAYSGESAPLRDGFRSCVAHNTVQVGSGDFARALSPFMWSHPYDCAMLHHAHSEQQVELWLSLSVNESSSFRVQRYIRVTEDDFSVVDKVQASEVQEVSQRWHVPFEAVQSEPRQTVFQAGRQLKFALVTGNFKNEALATKVAQRSTAYGELESMTTLCQTVSASDCWLAMQIKRSSSLEVAVEKGEQEAMQKRAQEFFK